MTTKIPWTAEQYDFPAFKYDLRCLEPFEGGPLHHCMVLYRDGKKMELSIQGSATNYCCPRRNGLRLDHYTHLEMMCWQDGERIEPSCLAGPAFQDIDGRSGDPSAYIPIQRLADFVQALLVAGADFQED